MTNQSLSELLQAEMASMELTPGTLLEAIVLSIDKDFVILDAGLKSDGAVPLEEFKNSQGELPVAVGDVVQVVLEAVDNGYGETLLSREKAKRCEAWIQLEKAYENGNLVSGIINGRVKGGFTVQLEDIRAFLPGSLVDIRPLRDTFHLEGKLLEFKILKLDQKRNNVVVSRKAALMSDQEEEREKLLELLQEGMVLKGVVKNLTEYGAFIDLGGVDGLLHITDMAWRRVRHPSEIVRVGDELTVQILKFDRERMRVSLGLKQLTTDPWDHILSKYEKGMKISGRVTNLTDYGCFVGLEGGVEGLVHISEMDWVHKNVHPSKLVKPGEEVEVVVLELDTERRRISLGLKQCKENPWHAFAENYPKGSEITGEIHSITEFGLFVGLAGGIDGLVHLTDLSWTEPGEKALQGYTKGQPVKAMVLHVEVPRERISLGIKQLTPSPVALYLKDHPMGSRVTGEFVEIDAIRKMARIRLAEEVFGEMPTAQFSAQGDMKPGQEVLVYLKDTTTAGRAGPAVLLLSYSSGEEHKPSNALSSAGQTKEKDLSQLPMSAMAEAFRIAREESGDKA